MQTALPQYDVGVIIGRFQVHELHEAHLDLIRHVCEQHDKVLILLGVSPLRLSTHNPLDFEARKQMILAEFPTITVLYVKDQPSDEVWSHKVDEMVADFCGPSQTAVLYGSRDSFIAHYVGTLPTRELLPESVMSGSAIRKQIARSSARASADFRAGVIAASQGRFPTSFATVDVAILDPARGILLGRKSNERLYRFIGGFADPKSPSYEADARREVQEETGVSVDGLVYLGSTTIDDWRYRNEPDGIKTLFFAATYVAGRAAPADDIEEVRWFSRDDPTLESQIVPTHRPLLAMLREAPQ